MIFWVTCVVLSLWVILYLIDKHSESTLNLRSEIAQLREALRPFANINIPDNWPAENVLTFNEDLAHHSYQQIHGIEYFKYIGYLGVNNKQENFPTIADYRRAKELLS